MARQSFGPWIFLMVAALAVAALAVGVYQLIPARKATESLASASSATSTADAEPPPPPTKTKAPPPVATTKEPAGKPPDPPPVKKEDAPAAPKPLTLTGHVGPVNSLAFTSATGELSLLSAGQDGSVRRWDVASGKQIGDLHEGRTPFQAVFAHPQEMAVLAAGAAELHLWKGDNYQPGGLALQPGPVVAHCFSGDGRLLVLGNGAIVRVFDPASRRELSQLRHAFESVLALAVSPDGRLIASSYPSGLVQIWDGRPGVPARPLASQKGLRINKLALAPKANLLAGAGDAIYLWDLTRGGQPAKLNVPGGADAVAFTPDGRWLCTGARSGRLVLHDLASKKEQPLATAGSAVRALAFSPDGRLLAAGTSGGAILVQPLPVLEK